MKVRAKAKEKAFNPVSIEITFETEDEIAMFFELFNHASLCDVEEDAGIDTDDVRSSISAILGGEPRYIEWHKKLDALIRK